MACNTYNLSEVAGTSRGTADKFLPLHFTDSTPHVAVQWQSWHTFISATQQQTKDHTKENQKRTKSYEIAS